MTPKMVVGLGIISVRPKRPCSLGSLFVAWSRTQSLFVINFFNQRDPIRRQLVCGRNPQGVEWVPHEQQQQVMLFVHVHSHTRRAALLEMTIQETKVGKQRMKQEEGGDTARGMNVCRKQRNGEGRNRGRKESKALGREESESRRSE